MANRRVLVKRRKAVRNIRKITRTMQLIATARFQAAHNRATAGKPYTEKLTQLVNDLSQATEGLEHPLMESQADAGPQAVVILTSNRGLCGGYNANVLRVAREFIAERETEGLAVEATMVGKKGIGYFRFLGRAMVPAATDIGDMPRFDQVEPLANSLMERFTAGEIASLHVVYMQYISAGRQRPVVERILPLTRELTEGEQDTRTQVDYEFSPEPEKILDELLPAAVRVRFYQCFTDAAVSEQIARMVAMKAATEGAEDMIKRLTQQYNRARQTQITMELLDIVGGANALA